MNVIGTYNPEIAFAPMNGWSIYLFLTESSKYPYGNHSIPYWVALSYSANVTNKPPQLGVFAFTSKHAIIPMIFPYSTTSYIVVNFRPIASSITLYIVNFTSPNIQPNITIIFLGNGLLTAYPNDSVLISVNFFHNGTLEVFIDDLTTGENENFAYNLNFHPSPGVYWTAVEAGAYADNWAILYWEIKSIGTETTSTTSVSTTVTSTTTTTSTTTSTSSTSSTVTSVTTTTTSIETYSITTTTTTSPPITSSMTSSSPSINFTTIAVLIAVLVVIIVAAVVFAKVRKR